MLEGPIQFELCAVGLHSRNIIFAFLKNDGMSCLYPNSNLFRSELSSYAKMFLCYSKRIWMKTSNSLPVLLPGVVVVVIFLISLSPSQTKMKQY